MTNEFEHDLNFFRELVSCGHNLYSWCYSIDFSSSFTNCPHSELILLIFSMTQDHFNPDAIAYDTNYPVFVTNSLGMMWITAFEKEPSGALKNIHILGPVFYDDMSNQAIKAELSRLQLSVALEHSFIKALSILPVISAGRMFDYAYMLHYTLTGEKITQSDLQYFNNTVNKSLEPDEYTKASHKGNWIMEQRILKNIETGNIEYTGEENHSAAMLNVGKMSKNNPLRQIKNQLIVFAALCTRAAIRGGLDYETAYTLSDQYILITESASNMAELADIAHSMQKDFIWRVHKKKTSTDVSDQIQKCCNYIGLHVEEKIRLAELAELAGYTPNYLSKKFQKEMHISISEYIMKEKIEHAKNLLKASSMTIQEISDALQFANQSYFGEQFKKIIGKSPGEYRRF